MTIPAPGTGPDPAPGEDILDQLDLIERRLAQMQRLVTIGTLAAGAVHEINNLLTPVLSYAHVARSSRGEPDQLERALNKIITGVESACEVAQAMLNYSRDSRGADQAEVAGVAEALDAAIGCLARDPARDGVEIIRRVEPGATVAMRPLALQQVLLNLVLNAREALKGRGGRITIEACTDADQTTIIVSDNGPGIAPEILDTLFEPFVTTNSDSGTITIGGAGLGLTVTRYLIEKAGGSIEASSEVGRGATFSISLPTAEHSVSHERLSFACDLP